MYIRLVTGSKRTETYPSSEWPIARELMPNARAPGKAEYEQDGLTW